MTQTITQLKAKAALKTTGVVVNLSYTDPSRLSAALRQIGITLIRVAVLKQGDVDRLKTLKTLVSGLRVNFLITAYSFDSASWIDQQGYLKQVGELGVLESVEGPNEMNAFPTHGPNDRKLCTTDGEKKAAFLAWTQAIRTWVDEHHPGLPIYSPTVVAFGENAWSPAVSNVAGLATYAAFHNYPQSGLQASNLTGSGDSSVFGNLPTTLGWAAKAIFGNASAAAVLTETGCSGASIPQPSRRVVDLQTQAKICLCILMDGLSLGLHRVIFYLLWDNAPDPDNNGGPEKHYGFFDTAWTPKPVALAVGRLQTLLQDTSADFKMPSLAVTVAGMDRTASAAGTHLIVPKSDGSVLLIFWNEAKIWNIGAGAPIIVAPLPVTVSWGESRTYDEFDVMESATPVAHGAGTSVVLLLRGFPLILRLRPA